MTTMETESSEVELLAGRDIVEPLVAGGIGAPTRTRGPKYRRDDPTMSSPP
jgi:hypothetical protein